MAKCPACGGEISDVGGGYSRCNVCGKIWKNKDLPVFAEDNAVEKRETPKAKPRTNGAKAGAKKQTAADSPVRQEGQNIHEGKIPTGGEVKEEPASDPEPAANSVTETSDEPTPGAAEAAEPVSTERQENSSGKSAEQREIDELRARLAAIEQRAAAQQANSFNAKVKRAKESFKQNPVYSVTKKWGLKVILPVFLLLIALITLLSCLCGLRGVFVNVNNPDEFYSFSATNYEYHGTLMGKEYVDKGTWKRSDGQLKLTYKDELFGKITESYDFSAKDSFKTIYITDDFGMENEYKRVSLMAISTPQKVTVKFYANDGSKDSERKRVDLGARVAEPEAPVRNGYEFMGWYTDKEGWRNGEGEQFSENDRVWEKTEYYANWKNATIFTLTGEFLVSPLEFTEGDNIETAYLHARGWNSLPEGVLRLIFKDSDDNEISGKSAPAANVSVVVVYDDRIVDGALQYVNPALKEYVIPAEVNVIASGAFDGCTALKKIYITSRTSSLTVQSGAFDDCEKLTSIEGYADTTAMKALIDVAGITRATVVAGTIVSYAFGGCTGLTSVTIGNSVTSIGGDAFYDCYGLTSVTIGEGVTNIGGYAFYNCSGLTSVTIPESVTYIGDGAFYNCSGLTSVTIGESVTSIGDEAFYRCTGLTSITIPDSVTSICRYAFEDCSGLTSVTIGAGVTSIGSEAFLYCYKLVEVYNKSSLSITTGSTSNGYIGYYAKNVYTAEGGSRFTDTSDGYRFLYDGTKGYLMGYYGEVTDITLPDSFSAYDGSNVNTYEIYQFAFYGDTAVTSVTIPDSVTSIGSSAFSGCTGLTSITIPNSVTSIGNYAFYGCTSLTEINWNAVSVADFNLSSAVFCNAGTAGEGITVTFGESVENIPTYLFYEISVRYRPNIKSVVIGSNVTNIGGYAFYNCSGLSSVVFDDTEGWQVSQDINFSSYTSLSSAGLANASTAATYLKSTYSYWYGGGIAIITGAKCRAANK